MFILHILNIHPTCSSYSGRPSSGANPQGKLIPGSSLHLLPPNQSHSPSSSWGTYPNNQLSLQGAMLCHLAPDGPAQGRRASMCNMSSSTLIGCRTRCFWYLLYVSPNHARSPCLSVLLAAKSRQHLEKKTTKTQLLFLPQNPPNPSKQYAFLLELRRMVALLGGEIGFLLVIYPLGSNEKEPEVVV